MLKFARPRPVRSIRCARPVPRQGARIVLFAVEVVCVEDGALERAGRGVLCRWWGRRGGCADGRMDGRVDGDCNRICGWEEKKGEYWEMHTVRMVLQV